MARSTSGAPPRSPSRSILTPPAWQISVAADVAHGRRGRKLVWVAHRVEVGDLAVDDLNGKDALQPVAGVEHHRRRRVADRHLCPDVGQLQSTADQPDDSPGD